MNPTHRIPRTLPVFALCLAALGLVQPAAGELSVTNGLALWVDASQLTGLTNGQQVETWTDVSGQNNNALRQNASGAGYPRYVTEVINGLPVVRFNSGGTVGDYFKFTRIANIRTVFWVLKENAGLSGNHFLLGDEGSIDFHRGGANGPLWDGGWASGNVKNGTTKLMGTVTNGTTTAIPPDQFQLISLVTIGNVQANQITQDRTYNGSWQGDIAEIIIYATALTSNEEEQVGSYLADKYMLSTEYPPLPPQARIYTFGPGALIAGTNIAWTLPYGTDATSLSPTYTMSSGATCDKASGSTHSFTNPVTYRVVSSDNAITNVYTVTVTIAPASSAKAILTFGPGASIAGTNISWMVPEGSDVTSLSPTYTVSEFAAGNPVSGTTRDFTTPQTYTVTAQDLSTTHYVVTVTVSPLAGVALWFDASQLTGQNGDPVNTWTDVIAAKNATAGAASPTLTTNGMNGHNVVTFNGTNQDLVVAAGDNPIGGQQQFTVAAVFRPRAVGAGDDGQWWQNTGLVDAEQPGLMADWGLAWNGNAKVGAGIGAPDQTLYGDALPLDTGHIAIYSWDGTSSGIVNLSVDGADVTTATGPTAARNSYQILFGRENGSVNYFNGDIAEIIIYTTALDSSQKAAVGRYLADKYALSTGYNSGPYVSITNIVGGMTNVPSDTTTLDIVGTNNEYTVGMWWTNSLGGGDVVVVGAPDWTCTATLLPGANIITVYGSNAAGIVASASATVEVVPEPAAVVGIIALLLMFKGTSTRPGRRSGKNG